MNEDLHNDAITDDSDLLATIWRRRRFVLAIALPFAVLFAVLAFIMTPVYRGQAVLVAASPDRSALGGSLRSTLGSVGDIASLVGVGIGTGDSGTEEAIAVLQSRQFTESFIANNNLMPELFSNLWNNREHRWKVPAAKQPTLNRAFLVFDNLRTVKRNTKTGMITLQVLWKDRVKAAAWTNALVQRLNGEMRTRAIASADASLVYLNSELASTFDVSTREAVNRLIENQVRQHMLANVTAEYALRVVDKALVEDADSPVKPRKVLLIGGGLLFGMLIGVACALLPIFRNPRPG